MSDQLQISSQTETTHVKDNGNERCRIFCSEMSLKHKLWSKLVDSKESKDIKSPLGEVVADGCLSQCTLQSLRE